jgi:iron complex outermembrane receptor protein
VPKLGFVWQARDAVQVFGNASRSYEPPLLLELTSFGNTAGFIDLEAQDTWQFEIGSRGRAGRWLRWDAAFFDAEIADEIINVNVPPFPGAPFTVPSYRNVDGTRHLGLELGATVMLVGGALQDIGAIAWRTAYTWSRFNFVDDPVYGDNYLAGAPGNVLRMEWRYDHQPRAGNAAGFGDGIGFWIAPGLDRSITDYYVDSANTEVNDAWASWKLSGGVSAGAFEVFVHLANLTALDYAGTVQVDSALGQYYETADGRAAVFGLRWSLQ